MREAYTDAGVDVEAGYEAVNLIKRHAGRASRAEVISGVGGFGALFSAKALLKYDDPVLVSGTDGVGTKLQIAMITGKHNTVGQDLVAMCVNDIVCGGAEPLFFLDYIAAGKVEPAKMGEIVGGVADGCAIAGCALVGGETAEHPGLMRSDDYDLAGFAVGVVERSKIIDGSRISAGDKIIGLASSGAHSNGFSLIRKILRVPNVYSAVGAVSSPNANSLHTPGASQSEKEQVAKERLAAYIPAFDKPLGDELLTPTRIYVKPVLSLIKSVDVLGLSHITGGGLIENIPRMLPKGAKARLFKDSWVTPPVFKFLMEIGGYKREDFYGIFNMGIGMAAAVRSDAVDGALGVLRGAGVEAFVIGEVVPGEGIEIC